MRFEKFPPPPWKTPISIPPAYVHCVCPVYFQMYIAMLGEISKHVDR